MARLTLLLILIFPTGLCAQGWDTAWRDYPDRWLFSIEEEEEESTPFRREVPFPKFSLGSVQNTYPYHSRIGSPTGSFRNSGVLVMMDSRVAGTWSDSRSPGWIADFRFQIAIFEATGLARDWNSGDPENGLTIYGGGIGGVLPIPFDTRADVDGFASVALDFGVAEVRIGRNERAGGVYVSSRVVAFPLWPLSVAADGTVILRSNVQTYDFGGHLGVMAFRNLFFDVGYRATWVSHESSPTWGISFGLSFYWRWSAPPFASPKRANTW